MYFESLRDLLEGLGVWPLDLASLDAGNGLARNSREFVPAHPALNSQTPQCSPKCPLFGVTLLGAATINNISGRGQGFGN